MQTSIAVSGDDITGTLKYLSSGQLVTDWGPGNFIALEFEESDTDVTDIKVGLENTLGAGMQSLDSDMDGVFKITNNNIQEFVVQTTKGDKKLTERYYLTTLVLEETGA